MHALVDENPVEIFGVDLEIRGRQLDRRPCDVPATPLDDRPPRATQAAIPPHGDFGPRDGPERPHDGVESAITLEEKRRSGDHEGRVRGRRDAQVAIKAAGVASEAARIAIRAGRAAFRVDAVRSGILAPCATLPVRSSAVPLPSSPSPRAGAVEHRTVLRSRRSFPPTVPSFPGGSTRSESRSTSRFASSIPAR